MRRGGQLIWQQGQIPRTNVFSWVNRDVPYLNDKWGFMVLVAGVEKLAGETGLWLLKLGLGGLLGFLLAKLMPRQGSILLRLALGCSALLMFSYRMALRAELVSYACRALILLLIPRNGRWGWSAATRVLLLMPLWAAMHGYWVLGPVLLAAHAVARPSHAALGVTALSGLAGDVSPFGWHNLMAPLAQLGGLGGGVLRASVSELRWPFLTSPWTATHLLGLILIGGAIWSLVSHLRHGQARAGAPLLVVLRMFLGEAYAPARWDAVGTLFVRTQSSAGLDERWRRWMGQVYLRHQRGWTPGDRKRTLADLRQAFIRSSGIALLRRIRVALERFPYERELYELGGEAAAAAHRPDLQRKFRHLAARRPECNEAPSGQEEASLLGVRPPTERRGRCRHLPEVR